MDAVAVVEFGLDDGLDGGVVFEGEGMVAFEVHVVEDELFDEVVLVVVLVGIVDVVGGFDESPIAVKGV